MMTTTRINKIDKLYIQLRRYVSNTHINLASHVLLSQTTDALSMLQFYYTKRIFAAAHKCLCIYIFICFDGEEWVFCVRINTTHVYISYVGVRVST